MTPEQELREMCDKGISGRLTWGEQNRVSRALLAALDVVKAGRVSQAADSSYPLYDTISRLTNASLHLLHDHSCDAHGYELVNTAVDAVPTLLDRQHMLTLALARFDAAVKQ